MRKENVSILAFCAVIVFALVAQLALAEFLAERDDAGTSDNSLESNSVDGDSDFSDARGRFKGTEDLQRVAVITDNVTGAQYLYVAAKWGISGGLVVLVDADGNPLIAEEAAMAPSNQAAGER